MLRNEIDLLPMICSVIRNDLIKMLKLNKSNHGQALLSIRLLMLLQNHLEDHNMKLNLKNIK